MPDGSALIGRERELAAIHDALARAHAGAAARLVILGEAGIGKTRLLGAAAELARGFGLRTLVGTAIEAGAGLPFLPLLAPLAEADDPRDGRPEAVAVRRLVRGDGSERARRPAHAFEERSRIDAASAARLIESIYEVLSARPTVLIVDDVHWADASTLTVLDHLGHRARDVPLAVILAARDDEPSWQDRVSVADGRNYAILAPRRLDRDEVARQLSGLLDAPPPPSLVDAVVRRSAGNPLFVEQLAAAEAAFGDDLPRSLRLLIDRRIGRMDRSTGDVLDALGVLGRAADRATLAAVTGITEDDVASSMDAAVRGGIAVTSSAGADLRHPVFREAILAGLDPARARTLHDRAADRLEVVGSSAGEIASHRWLGSDPRAAWSAAMAAGDAAEAALAFAEVRMHLEHAIERWPEDELGLTPVGLRASRAAWIAGDAPGALRIARDVSGRVPADVALLNALGGFAWDAGERAESAATFERISPLLDRSVAPVDRSRALWGLGRARVGAGRFEEAVDLAREAADVAAQSGETEAEAEAWMLLAMARAFLGSFDGIPSLVRGLELAERSGAPSAIGQGSQFLTDLLETSGDLDRALEVSSRGIDVSEPLGLAGFHGSDLRGRAALILINLGRWDEAAAVVEPADPRAFPSLARAVLAIRRGDDAAVEPALAAAAIGGAIGGPGSLGGWLEIARVEAAWTRGDEEGAWAALGRVPTMPGIWRATLEARSAWWAARLRPDPSLAESRRAAALGAHEPDVAAALAADVDAETLAVRGADHAHAPEIAEAWAVSVAAWSAARRPFERATARLREASARFAAGDRDLARAALHEVTETAAGLGAQPLLDRAADLARRARVSATSPRRSRADPETLTSRELEVLALVAEGMTNRSIGERLFISPKTVEIHLTRTLDKLGASTRGEAVAVARRRGLLS